MIELISLLFMLSLFALGYVDTKGMTKEEKELREDIDSLFNEMRDVSEEAKEEGWTEERSEKHENLFNDLREKKQQLEAMERENGLEEELNSDAKPVNAPHKFITENEYEKEKDLFENTAKILTTLANKGMGDAEKFDTIGNLQTDLYKSGHYEDYANSVDAFSTLTDSDGGIFLPTTISERIFDIAEEHGAFSQNGLRVPMSTGDGSRKIPNLLGQLTFYAVNEGSEAKASKLTFSGIKLEQNKWMTYVPWTNEMDDAQGRRLMNILLRKLGEALARMRDEAVVNADGTSDYHNLKGLVNRGADSDHAEVRESTAATGHSSFSDIDPDDFLDATLDISKSIREGARFALDPDWRVYLKKMKDADDNYYYRNGDGTISIEDGQFMIHGYPVDFTEAIPSTDGSSVVYGVAYVPDYYAFADNGRFSVEQFNTGSIPDTDGNSDSINLLSQDMKASRVKTFFDFELSQLTKTENSTEKGAFTVLKTA